MIYLASPYSHTDLCVREARYDAACCAAAKLIAQGHVVFSPVAHSHGIVRYGLPVDWNFWERQDRRFVEMCDELWALKLDGWHESIGVQAEIDLALEIGKAVRFLSADECQH